MTFFILFFVFLVIVLPILYVCLQCNATTSGNSTNNRDISRRARAQRSLDRQNNVEQGRDHRSFNDIFFIEPNSPEAARIREQLEKDDKDLPSYDDVIRMCNLTTPTAAAAPATPTPTMESTSICLAALPAPPYSEVDPHLHLAENSLAVSSLEQTPSTSRAHTTSTTMV
ncbi:uncharacterized protein LOC6560808 isoform X4 [Drosophila grimshawi]|uniref:uncharacterized protein LOC6560808 isoform X4 n=1 Tax=Drosophila grimshawi TaxID=7222 RepID=UPI000C86F935|nr:uncharacterized protein LOC6560808 isoform X4 [Drosophila grimshawi]